MPRLPTIRVIGSQFISTSLRSLRGAEGIASAMTLSLSSLLGLVTAFQPRSRVPPSRLLVQPALRDAAERSDGLAVDLHRVRGEPRSGRRVHERHELLGEPGHRAADADPAHVWTAAEAVHPAPLRDVAIHHRPPPAQLHQALVGSVVVRADARLVVARPVAALVHGALEEPARPWRFV